MENYSMTIAPKYKMTEEVIRQTVEVQFKQDNRWEVSFTNPTAGPWKKIRLGGYAGGEDLRFAKEEDRPDLILSSLESQIFLILEAKDDIKKLLTTEGRGESVRYIQLEKSINVFHKELKRIEGIMKNEKTASCVSPKPLRDYWVVFGYVIPELTEKLSIQKNDLSKIHLHLAHRLKENRLFPFILLIVGKNDIENLNVYYEVYHMENTFRNRIIRALPSNITPH
jgi:hypothetical protein